MKNKSEIKIGAILSYIIIALNMIIGIAYSPMLTRSLGQSEYGLYSLVSTIISYLTVLDFGFGNAIIIYTSKYRTNGEKDKEQKLHGMFMVIYTIIGLIAAVTGIFIAINANKIFGYNMSGDEVKKAQLLMYILSGNLFFTFIFSIFSSIITAYEKFVFQKIINIIRIVIQPVIMLILLNKGYKSIALVVVITILNVLSLLANAIYCRKKLNIKFKIGKFDKKLFIQISSYSVWIFLNMIMSQINWSLDQTVLGIVSGTIAVAIYSIGSKLDQIYMSLSTAINGVLLPKVAKMEAKQATNEEFSEIFIKVGRIEYIIIALVMSGFIIFGKEFIYNWVGNQYNESYMVALLLMLPTTFTLIEDMGINIIQAKNMYKYRVMVLFIFAVLNGLISIVLAKKFGTIGAAAGTAVSIILGQGFFMNWFYYKKVQLDIPKFWKEIIKLTVIIIGASVIALGIKYFWKIDSWFSLAMQVSIYSSIYIILMYKFGLNNYEKSILNSVRRKKRKENV